MHTEPATIGRMFCVRLDPGDDLLEGLRQAVADLGIQNGVFLSGIGSLTSYHVHVVSSTDLPPTNAFMKGEGPFDILAITGQIMGGRVHAHLTFSDEEKAMGGHLEPGSHVLTFAIITLAELPDNDLSRWDRVGKYAVVHAD